MILVKAGKVQDFVSILIENNCVDEIQTDGHTTKADKFLHGFGTVSYTHLDVYKRQEYGYAVWCTED